jgi:hypothetical protein
MINKPLGNSHLNKQSNRGYSNGRSRGNGRGRGSGGTGHGTLSGNQGPAKDALNKYRWCKQGHLSGEEGC